MEELRVSHSSATVASGAPVPARRVAPGDGPIPPLAVRRRGAGSVTASRTRRRPTDKGGRRSELQQRDSAWRSAILPAVCRTHATRPARHWPCSPGADGPVRRRFGIRDPTPVDGARLDRALPSSGHAADDPIAAVWEWLQAALTDAPVPRVLAVIGFGDGALLDTLDRHAPQTRVLALEPDPVSAGKFLARPKRDGWHGTGRLLYLAGPDYVGADEAWRIFPTGVIDPPVLTFRASPTSAGADLEAARVLEKILFGVRANDVARRRFAPRYLINSLRNVPAMMAGADVRVLSGACTGVPAVIAAAGPSLDAVVDDLGRFADRALLIAADTALRPLLAAGVSPQLVVGLDPSATNARHLLSLPECRDTWLVSESALDRQAAAAFEGRTFWFRAANHHPWPWFNEFGLDIGRLDVWGSVLTGAFELACLAGCDPIVIVGADLSYTGGRPYARGTTYRARMAARDGDRHGDRRCLGLVGQQQADRACARSPRHRHRHDTVAPVVQGLDDGACDTQRPARDQRDRCRHVVRRRHRAWAIVGRAHTEGRRPLDTRPRPPPAPRPAFRRRWAAARASRDTDGERSARCALD